MPEQEGKTEAEPPAALRRTSFISSFEKTPGVSSVCFMTRPLLSASLAFWEVYKHPVCTHSHTNAHIRRELRARRELRVRGTIQGG